MGIFNKKKESSNNPNLYDEAHLLRYLSTLSKEDFENLLNARNPNNNNKPLESKSLTYYYDLIKSVFNNNFNSIGNNPHTRNQRYEIYDEMDESTAYISSALDILSDDATQIDSEGVIIHIESDSEKINNLVSDFFSNFEIEEKISKWARAVAKYGDLFIKVEGSYGRGVSSINDTIYPGCIDRKDFNGKLLAFANNQGAVFSNNDLYAPWEFVHFRHKGDIYKEESRNNKFLGESQFDKSLTSAYGQSVLRPAIKTYAQLRFVENMILLSRLTNSIRRNIFLINVGDVAPDKVYETIVNYASLLKKDVNLNIEDGIYTSSKHTINYDEDIFIPVSDPKNDVRIEQVGGDVNIAEQYDLEYLLNKLFSALKIPKAYLNYEQDLNARSTLIQLDIRYARSVGQLQNTMTAGLLRLAKIHLAYLGLDPEEVDLNISLTSVSAIDEEARTEQLQKQVETARSIWEVLTTIKESVDQEGSTELNLQAAAEEVVSKYLDLEPATIDSILNRKSSESLSQNVSRIRSHRIYTNSDLHEMYPTESEMVEFQRIRESLLRDEDKEVIND